MTRIISMKALTLFSAFLAILITVNPANTAKAREGIAIIVNDDAISSSDVSARLRLMMASSGLGNSPDLRARLLPQVIGILTEEQIKLQEAERLEIEITPEEINQGFAALAAQNRLDIETFKTMMRKEGISPDTMERQIKAQIAWSKVVQSEIRPKIRISETDVDDRIKRLESAKGKTEYLLAEIFLPFEAGKNEASVRQLANKLSSEIQSGKAPFFRIAQQFSKAAGAAKGGDLGWVQEGQLPEELDKVLPQLGKNSASQPVRTPTGYHLLYVRDKRKITDKSIPPREAMFNAIGTERMDRLQRRYLFDLQSAAFIESRV